MEKRGNRIKLGGDVLGRLKRVMSGVRGLEFAALFGSLTGGGSHHDIDVAVRAAGRGKYRAFCRIVERLAEAIREASSSPRTPLEPSRAKHSEKPSAASW